jgi:hypothetical protein
MPIKLLVFAIWTAIHPTAPRAGAASEIASAIETVVMADRLPPVFGSQEEDAAVMAYYAFRESWLRKNAVGDGGKSFGVWQEQCAAGKADVLTQARAWVGLLRAGARACPQSPAAPLSGGCKAGRQVADRRVARALALLNRIRPSPPDPSADVTSTPVTETTKEPVRAPVSP